ncbi:MAG: response regulator [bacterium]
MSHSEQDFLEELRKAFATEAGEHLQTLASGLIETEKQKDPVQRQAAVESIYRAAHSLKGAARSVNLPGIGAICQAMESVFSVMKKEGLVPDPKDFDLLQRAVDTMSQMLAAPAGTPDPDIGPLIMQLDSLAAPERRTSAQGAPAPTPRHLPPDVDGRSATETPPPVRPATPDTIRIATAKLDAILLQTEEMISIKLTAEQRIAELADVLAAVDMWKAEWEKAGPEKRVAHRLPGAGINGSLTHVQELEARLRALLAVLRADRRATGMLVDQLLESTKTVLMLPFSTLLQTFPKMARDISRAQNKEVNLVLTGGDVEIDKRILELMKDPLIHLLRNGIDHGIEKPDVRTARHKEPAGTLTLAVSPAEGNRVQILVSDDGAGIDAGALRKAAVQRGMLSGTEAAALDDRAALGLMFQSGVSTSALVTDLSGRGLGMAIVQEAVDKLGGGIRFETTPDVGTTFQISLPLTLATFHGLLIEESGQLFAVPTSSIDRVLRVRKEEVRSVENRETILVNGTPLALVRLGSALGLAPSRDKAGDRLPLPVMVLSAGSQRMAFSVDRLLHEQEILLKGLGRQLARVRNVAGATVLGNGKIVPVLNVADLFKSAVRVGQPVDVPRAPEAETRRKSILVAEDSITSRMLLKNILASAGFEVHTVIDGVEAWTALREKPFDAVVSDIQMPRMSGLDLTAKIRGDARLAELPVVLVTSLESRADRERGIEVGANAYLVKSSFEQSNLLEVIRRLI